MILPALIASLKSIHPKLANLFLDYEPGITVSNSNASRCNWVQYHPGIQSSKQFIDQDPDSAFVKKWIPEPEIGHQ